MGRAIKQAREAGAGIMGVCVFTIMPLIFAFPLLIAFIYLWEHCLGWPGWLAFVIIFLAFMGMESVIGVAILVSGIAGLIQGFWIPVLALVIIIVIWPFAFMAAMTMAGWLVSAMAGTREEDTNEYLDRVESESAKRINDRQHERT